MNKLLFLDGLRGISAVWVVLGHSNVARPEPAVDAFFFLSSFLLTANLLVKISSCLESKKPLKEWLLILIDYFIKRIGRIYPVLILVAVCLEFLSYDDKKLYYEITIHYNIWRVLSLRDTFHVLWSIPVEFLYYFCIPFISLGFALMSCRTKLMFVTMILIMSVYFGVTQHRIGHTGLNVHYMTFLTGSAFSVLYISIKKKHSENFLVSSRMHIILNVVSIFCAIYILTVAWNRNIFNYLTGNQWPTDQYPYISLPLGFIIVKESLLPGHVGKFFENNLLVFCGKISLSLYLLHPFPLKWNIYIPVDRVFFNVLASILISTISYYTIENPSMKLVTAISKWVRNRGTNQKIIYNATNNP